MEEFAVLVFPSLSKEFPQSVVKVESSAAVIACVIPTGVAAFK